MRILVCPDSFKGTLTAREASEAMARGVLEAFPQAETELLPVGDGGEGTVAALVSALRDVEEVVCKTVDPLYRPIEATYAIAGGKTALIESAAASGLTLLDADERDIMQADTYGTGLLIADAYTRGIREFVIGMGGTATCDGGYGAWKALTAHPDFGSIDPSEVNFTLLCDVDNPLCGPQGAAAVFGPQKGASPEMIPKLEERLEFLADFYFDKYGLDIRDVKGAGAAGGLAGMLTACFGARVCRGIGKVLEMLDFDERLAGADMVITGEGRADRTTLRGKAPMGILEAAGKRGVPVVLIAGKTSDVPQLLEAGFAEVVHATPENATPDVSYAEYLARATAEALKKLKI